MVELPDRLGIAIDADTRPIEDALRDAKGQVDEVQKRLSLPRKTLYDRLTKYGLRAKDYRR